MSTTIPIEVVFALPQAQMLLSLFVPVGTTVREALVLSQITTYHPEIDLNHFSVGIYGKKMHLESILQENDRVEIYRPLLADPKEIRRHKALMTEKSKGK